MTYSIQVNGIPWRNGLKYVNMVVWCYFLVEVLIHRGMLTMSSSWRGGNVITPNFNYCENF
jgi:hypothetical protein